MLAPRNYNTAVEVPGLALYDEEVPVALDQHVNVHRPRDCLLEPLEVANGLAPVVVVPQRLRHDAPTNRCGVAAASLHRSVTGRPAHASTAPTSTGGHRRCCTAPVP